MRRIVRFFLVVATLLCLLGVFKNLAMLSESESETRAPQEIEIFDGTVPDSLVVPAGETVVWYGSIDSFMNGSGDKLVTEATKQTITSGSGEAVSYIDLEFLSGFKIELTFAPTVGDVYSVHIVTLNTAEDAELLLLSEAGRDGATFEVASTVALNHFGADTVDACFEFEPTISASQLDIVNSGDEALQIVAVFVTKKP